MVIAATVLASTCAAVALMMLSPTDVVLELDGHLVGGLADVMVTWVVAVAAAGFWKGVALLKRARR